MEELKCTACGLIKPVSEFVKDPRRKHRGYDYYCRACRNAMKSSPEALAKRRLRKAWAKPEARAYHKSYHQRDYVKQSNIDRVNRERQDPANRDKLRARAAIRNGVHRKTIVRPDRCERCKRTAKTDAHHFLGYAWENRFKVDWLCRWCHKDADKELKSRTQKALDDAVRQMDSPADTLPSRPIP